MTQRIIPMGDRILVRPHTIAPRKSGGLSVPDAQQEEPTTGVVVAVGQEAFFYEERDCDGNIFHEHGVAVGWVVVWRQHAGFDVTIDGEIFKTLRLEEIEHRIVEDAFAPCRHCGTTKDTSRLLDETLCAKCWNTREQWEG
jgi:co-chaperonin GroES (HSP10)